MRAGMIWLVFVIFWAAGVDTVIVLRTGVERLMDGRLLRAAGSMSGMAGDGGLLRWPDGGANREIAIWQGARLGFGPLVVTLGKKAGEREMSRAATDTRPREIRDKIPWVA